MTAYPATPSQTIGPFFRLGLNWMDSEELVRPEDPGAVQVHGRVFDGAGDGVADAMVEIWTGGRAGVFGRSLTDPDGCYRFMTPMPEPIASGQAPHLSLLIFARGLLRAVHTRMYFPTDQANATDAVLTSIKDPGVRASLLAVPEPDGSLRFDIWLQGDKETVFFVV